MFDRTALTFHNSYAEYSATYVDPAFENWDFQKIAPALFRGLSSWGVKLKDIRVNEPSTGAADQNVKVELFNGNVIVEVGIGKTRLMATNPNWKHRETLHGVGEEVLEIVHTVLKAELERQIATIGFHFAISGKSSREVTEMFLNPNQELINEPGARSFGVSVYRDDGDVVLDTSMMYEDALFMKITRSFAGDSSLQEIEETMYGEEMRYLGMLGLSGG